MGVNVDAFDETVSPTGSPNLLGPRLAVPRMGEAPVEKKPFWFIAGLSLAQFALFVALLGPVMVSMQLKINTLVSDPAEQAAMLGRVLPLGALAAVVGNALFGRLSDRTTSRFGRRRPWVIGGTVVLTLALALLALATKEWMLTLGWFIAQLGANAAFSPFMATLADQLPDEQYAKTSALLGIMQNLGVMVVTWLATFLADDMLSLFMVPALIGLVGMVVYALMIPDPVLLKNRHPFDLKTLIGTFWTNPFRFPDFGLAWWGRFFITFGSFMFTTFRLQYMTQHLELEVHAATAAVATGVTIYTVVLMAASYAAGWLSDRTGKRKFLVVASTALFAVGLVSLYFADSVAGFYIAEVIMGIAFGIYVAVDLALVLEVLPDPKDAGKDLGVFNMANALPQSLAPAVGGWLVASLGGGTNFLPLLLVAGIVTLVGALVIIPIKKVS